MSSWYEKQENSSWRKDDWGGKSWGSNSKSWGSSNDRSAKTESWGWHAKEDTAERSENGNKRSWGDNDDSDAKRLKQGEESKGEVKQESASSSWTPQTAPQHPSATVTWQEAPLIPSRPTPLLPMTPVGLGTASRPIPATPAEALAPGRMPMTPVGAFPSQPARMPMTPVGAFAPQSARLPMTPVGAFSGVARPKAPGTPVGIPMPGTPTVMTMPTSVPPGTPAGPPPMMPMPTGAPPGTPSGPPPGTPGVLPGTPSMPRYMVTPARAEVGPANTMPAAQYLVPAAEPQQQIQPYVPTVDIFNDGRAVVLRHAPRRRVGTGEKMPAPGTRASKPEHWKTVAVGSKEPKEKKKVVVEEDPVPSFDQWRKTRRKDGAKIVSIRNAGQIQASTPTPAVALKQVAPAAMFDIPIAPVAQFPIKEEAAPLVRARFEALPPDQPTPLPGAADMTPNMGGVTPRFPAGLETPRLPGVETPGFGLGVETPLPGGDMTPRIPDFGDVTPHVPTCPTRTDLRSKVKDESLTPMDAGFHTPMLPAQGADTPMLPRQGADTPMLLGQGADTPMLPAQGADTPMLPQGAETPRLPPGVSGDETPMVYDTGSMTPIPVRASALRTS